MSWDVNQEKLLCHFLLDDAFAPLVSSEAGPAFFRGFIVQDRTTGSISMKFRFKYKDDTRNWFALDPKEQGPDTVRQLQYGIRKTLEEASFRMGIVLPECAIKFFLPADDGGDGSRTLAWLVEQDLIEVSIEKRDE
jgi:hypothetical protein